LNAMLLVIGWLSLQHLPLCEYPQVKIPEFTVHTHYHNGDASYMEEIVTNAIEDKVMSLPAIEKIQSETSQGSSSVYVTFKVGTNIDTAQMGLREAVSQANLPKEVPQPNIVRRGSKDNNLPFFLILVESKSSTPEDLTHYTNCILRHSFRGIDGVAEVEVLGSPYQMDIALSGKKMRQFGINANTVFTEIETSLKNQPLGKLYDIYPLRLDQPLNKPEDFKKIMIPMQKKPAVMLGDFSAVTLKKNNGDFRFHVNGKPGVAIQIKETSTANPLEVSDELHEKINGLKKALPKGTALKVIVDQAEFIRSSLNQVRNSLIEAIICVMIVVGLFLGSARLSLVPLITIPLSLVGSLAVLMAFGYSINTLTLLGAVLATGLVVDDAIVVLENINRRQVTIKNTFEAALLGTKEISFAIIAMTLTLASVYLPIIFQKDALGQLFSEFAVSLSAAVIISGITAITLTPWMSMIAIKDHTVHKTPKVITWLEEAYAKVKTRINPWPNWIFLCIFISCIIGSFAMINSIPKGIGPKEDRGVIGLWVPSMPGNSMDEREQIAFDLDNQVKDLKEVRDRISFIFHGGCSVCCMLSPPGSRTHTEELHKNLQKTVDANIPYTCYSWTISTGIPGMDNYGQASDIQLAIVSSDSLKNLHESGEQAMSVIRKTKAFTKVHIDKTQNTTAQKCTIHPYLAQKFKLSREDILGNIEIYLSGKKHLNFFKDNQKYPVNLHTESLDQDLNRIFIPNDEGQLFSLGTVAAITQEQILEPILHLNQKRMMLVKMTANPETNVEKEKHAVINKLRRTLVNQEAFGWLDSDTVSASNHERMIVLFLTALVFIYAILCIQFESFFDPVLILLTVPFATFGGLLWVWLSGQTLNIFSQIGLITLIGLISKHGILLVEFANKAYSETSDWNLAFEKSLNKRFRPIMMTTAAMVLGCIPLSLASGPGAEIRQSLAGVLIGGLCFGTISTLFLFPRLATFVKGFSFSHYPYFIVQKKLLSLFQLFKRPK